MTVELEYKNLEDKSALELKHVQEFIELHDNSFQPKISTKVSISEYAKKLCNHSKIITCHSTEKIFGMCAFYCHPKDYEYAFLSYLAVDNTFRGKGIANHLISMMINQCKKQNIKGIKTSTWKGNRAVGLYLSNGFNITEATCNNRVELTLNF